MKKLLIVLLAVVFMTGCGQINSMQINYNKYMKTLMSVNTNSDYVPCDVEITYDKITDDEVSYQITLDNPKENMRNLNVVVTHDMETNDGYPSIGVFDEDPINLNIIQTADEHNKGVVLVGYFKYSGSLDELHTTFKISINYINESIEEKTIYFIKSI